MAKITLNLDQLVEPFEARVVVRKNASGEIIDAHFDLSGLPRLDPVLVGKPVAEVPDIVKRLCGLCPVAHHLAGIRALDSYYGIAEIPETAQLVRALLLHGAIIEQVAWKFVDIDRDTAIATRRYGKAVLAMAGCPGHFPDVAIPGGVRNAAEMAELDDVAKRVAALPVQTHTEDDFAGLDVAVCTRDGNLNPLGDFIRAGEKIVPAQEFYDHVIETRPGDPAPRPTFDGQKFRVGPVAQARLLGESTSPLAAQKALLQRSLTAVAEILTQQAVHGGLLHAEKQSPRTGGVGVVDGPRGLLIHRYDSDGEGNLVSCNILTPTAQNEWWLSDMLASSLAAERIEAAIRAADPCLPISSAPAGAVNVKVEEA
ncbi:coenzyme F420-reducing hydrogenase, alpha subunit [Corynebacterium epidermidicanis]|uniref:Coenzyme F420-reducing hydrogenase, alpha subunit n=2 Tax=Corynebacterium epidermidicanis TaxID=1050174 RepID=A0A0G3GSI1_9CORY|nr:coenzyme F420-reducing hydrogenase, alpha subunit [Corynebacterium epidermidicanis]